MYLTGRVDGHFAWVRPPLPVERVEKRLRPGDQAESGSRRRTTSSISSPITRVASAMLRVIAVSEPVAGMAPLSSDPSPLGPGPGVSPTSPPDGDWSGS